MATTKDEITKGYSDQLKAQTTKIDAAYKQNKATYDKQLADAPEKYQGIRNQAYTENAMSEQSRKENMANMGMSGAGGTSQTLQQRNQTSLLNAVGDANRQQQDFTDNINLALGNLNTQHSADKLSAQQQNQADINAALSAYDQWSSDHDLNVKQLEQTKKNSTFDQAWALLQKGHITRATFEDWTGYKLRR